MITPERLAEMERIIADYKTLYAIARDLAAFDPLRDVSIGHNSIGPVCVFCNGDADMGKVNHKESCPYRRAVEAIR